MNLHLLSEGKAKNPTAKEIILYRESYCKIIREYHRSIQALKDDNQVLRKTCFKLLKRVNNIKAPEGTNDQTRS